MTTGMNRHFVLSGLPAAHFVFARRWASDPQWKEWAIYPVITGILVVAFFVALGMRYLVPIAM